MHAPKLRLRSTPYIILVLGGRAPFGQHQESRPLARSNDILSLQTGSQRGRKEIRRASRSIVTPRAKRVGRTPSSPDRPRLVPLALKYTRLPRPKPNREPVCRLQHSGFEWLCKQNRLRPEPIRFVGLDFEHAQNYGKSVNRGLPILDLARGRDSWC